MTDFNKGDKIRVTIKEGGANQTIWLAEDEDEPGVLFTYHGLDPFAPNVELDVLLEDPDLEVELVTPFAGFLPTVPGNYEDKLRSELPEAFLEGLTDDEKVLYDTPWVLNEDGTWTAPDGTSAPAENNWLLAVHGFEFSPWEGR